MNSTRMVTRDCSSSRRNGSFSLSFLSRAQFEGLTRELTFCRFSNCRFGQLDTLRLVRSLAEFRPKMLTMSFVYLSLLSSLPLFAPPYRYPSISFPHSATQTPESLAFKEEAFQRSLSVRFSSLPFVSPLLSSTPADLSSTSPPPGPHNHPPTPHRNPHSSLASNRRTRRRRSRILHPHRMASLRTALRPEGEEGRGEDGWRTGVAGETYLGGLAAEEVSLVPRERNPFAIRRRGKEEKKG